jgi:hypothetical protein
MDRLKQLQHLAEAERNIARGEHNISEQELRIADLDCHGYDTILARSLLETFRVTQAQRMVHRDQILRELAQ